MTEICSFEKQEQCGKYYSTTCISNVQTLLFSLHSIAHFLKLFHFRQLSLDRPKHGYRPAADTLTTFVEK